MLAEAGGRGSPTSPGATRGLPCAPLGGALVILALALASLLAVAGGVVAAFRACTAEVRVAVPPGAAALRVRPRTSGQAKQGQGQQP